MTPQLAFAIATMTCPRCQGEGKLHSRAAKYDGESWESHVDCDLCNGVGVNPAAVPPVGSLECT